MKKLWIIIGIAAAVLICLLAGLLIFSRGGRDGGDTDALYPYTYEQKDGKLKLRISGAFPKDCVWTAETDAANVTVTAGRQNAKRALFTLTAREQGSAGVSFYLEKPGGLSDRRYEIALRFYVTDALVFVPEERSEGELTGLRGEDGNGFSYRVAQLSDTALAVRVTHDPSQLWSFERTEGTVLLNGWTDGAGVMLLADDQSYSELRVEGSRAGSSTVYLTNGSGDCIELRFSTGSEGATTLLSSRIMGEGDARIVADTEYADKYGETAALIEGVLGDSVGSVGRWLSRDDDLTTFKVGVSEYELEGAKWLLCIATVAEEADFSGHEEPTKQVTMGKLSAKLYAGDYGVRCVWRTGGKTYLLESEDGGAEAAETLTLRLLEALGG